MKRISIVLVCVFLVFSAAGCAGWFGKPQEKTAAELAREGESHFQEEDYSKAIKAYEQLRDWYPYSPHAKTAELRIADAHYELEQYEQALTAYQHYERLHPSDSEIPYVIFQIGMCHYERLKGIDRTQVPTRNALEAFNRLQSRFPQSGYAEKAGPKIQECRKHLAGHEFYVGRFYFKSAHYKAALERFENLLKQYPEVEAYREEAKNYAERSRTYLSELAEKQAGTETDSTLRPTESRDSGTRNTPMIPGQ